MRVVKHLQNPVALITDFATESYKHVDVFTLSDMSISSLAKYRAAVIKHGSLTIEILKSIRAFKDPRVNLMPAFVLKDHRTKTDEYTEEVFDGVIQNETPYNYYMNNQDLIDSIYTKINEISRISFDKRENLIVAFKVLRFMYTRGIPLKPVPTVKSAFGYIYPNVDIYLLKDNYQQFVFLEFLENKYFVQGLFQDKIHFCNSCYSGFLNFREICPGCGTPDLDSYDLIHHFVCAYVGPERDFGKPGESVCPKCQKELKHIGVDYDRPSTVYECNECGKTFQEPEVDAVCINCGKKTHTENLILKTIKQYEITPLGENSAKFGISVSIGEALKSGIDMLDLETFKMLLKIEVERIKRYKISNSSVGVLVIKDFLNLFASFGAKAGDISQEISSEIKGALRLTDVVSHLSNSALVFLLPETSEENGHLVMGRLKERISELIKTNFEQEAEIETNCVGIGGGDLSESLLENILKDV